MFNEIVFIANSSTQVKNYRQSLFLPDKNLTIAYYFSAVSWHRGAEHDIMFCMLKEEFCSKYSILTFLAKNKL